MNVGILGGGVSGLAAAHYLLKQSKVTGITVLEASNRLGGWIDTTRNDDGILYEHGPRTVRPDGPNGANTLALIQELGLESKVRPIIKGHPTTENRLIYVDGNLHKLPSSFWSLFRKLEPFKFPLFLAGIKDLVTSPKYCEDDSLYNFVQRRFGADIAQYAADPMMRGIFAGDAKDLSVYAIAGSLFEMEQKDGGVFKSVLKKKLGLNREKSLSIPFPENENCELVKKARLEKWAIWSLEGGLETLIETLKQHLVTEGVEILVEAKIREIVFEKNPQKITYLGDQFQHDFQHSFISIPAYSAANLFQSSRDNPLYELLYSIPYVDVAVVNVEYDKRLELHTGEAFGLLVPSCQKDIPILGIIFDTCAFPQHTSDGSERTIFTVMMGGKWFENLFGPDPNPKDLENLAIQQVKQILNLKQNPCRVLTKIHKKCIAQYTLGHKQRVGKIRDYVNMQNLPISFIGNSYDGVAINDAIMSSRKFVSYL